MSEPALFVDELASHVHVRHLMTPFDQAMFFSPGDSEANAAQELEARGFDCAPVVHSSQVIGRVARSRLDSKGSQAIARRVEPIAPRFLIGASASISDLVARLEADPWLFVVERQGIDGIVTPSDLNKQASRTYFFLLVAAYEVSLAEHIRRHLKDQETALDYLTAAARLDVLNRHQALLESNLNLDLVAAMTLANLQAIVGRSKLIRPRWAPTATAWKKKTSGIVEFRNRVAHPSRPIIGDRWNLATLKRRLETLRELTSPNGS